MIGKRLRSVWHKEMLTDLFSYIETIKWIHFKILPLQESIYDCAGCEFATTAHAECVELAVKHDNYPRLECRTAPLRIPFGSGSAWASCMREPTGFAMFSARPSRRGNGAASSRNSCCSCCCRSACEGRLLNFTNRKQLQRKRRVCSSPQTEGSPAGATA